MSMPTRMPNARAAALMQLTHPRSLAVYDSYDDAQMAVDYLSDHQFPVQNVMIVGTDLRQVERVTGRLNTGKAILGGAASGLWLGVMLGLLMSVFDGREMLPVIASAMLAGAVFGGIWAAIGYSLTRGRRDFTSVTQVIATRYEILVESEKFTEANAILRPTPAAPAPMSGPAPQTPAPEFRPGPEPHARPDGPGATDSTPHEHR